MFSLSISTKYAALFCLLILLHVGCFKNPYINQNAVIHEQACIKYLDTNELAKAKTHCEICLEYDSSHPECLNGLGLIALLDKDEEKAKKFFHQAIRQNNDFAQAINNLGVIYFNNTDFVAANKHFENALKIDPGNIDARYNSALCNIRLYQRRDAKYKKNPTEYLLKGKEQIEKIIAMDETYEMAFRELGLIELYLGKQAIDTQKQMAHISNAKKAFETCLKNTPTADVCYEGLGQAEIVRGDYFASWKNFFLCLSENQSNVACKEGIIDAYEKSVKVQKTRQEFTNYMQGIQKNPSAHQAFCHVLFEKGFSQEGVNHCQIALTQDPSLCEINFTLANYYSSISYHNEAKGHCKKFLICSSSNESKIKTCEDILINTTNSL